MLDQILENLRFAESEEERVEAAEKLGEHSGEQVILALIDALGDEEATVVGASMESLKKQGPAAALHIRGALLDGRMSVRWGAAELLEDYPSPETETALTGALGDESPHARGAAARSVSRMATKPNTITQLQKLLEDADPFPRYQALSTLLQVAPQSTNEGKIVRRDLHSKNPLARVAAIHYVRKNRRYEWENVIVSLCQDSDFRVRRAALWCWERFNAERR